MQTVDAAKRRGAFVVGIAQQQADARARVFAVANQKGGVGKTTTTVNLSACFAERGLKTLVIDLDPQANATTSIGIDPRGLDASIYDVLLQGIGLDEIVEPTMIKDLHIAPSSLDLAGAEVELVAAFGRERKLREAISEAVGEYDIIMVDCPPSLGLLTINGLTAADEVMVPIQAEYFALEGLTQLVRNIGMVQRSLNSGLELTKVVLTMYDARTNLSRDVAREVRAHYGDKGLLADGAAHGAIERGPVLRPTHHSLRFSIQGRDGLSRPGKGGAPWHVVAASGGGSER